MRKAGSSVDLLIIQSCKSEAITNENRHASWGTLPRLGSSGLREVLREDPDTFVHPSPWNLGQALEGSQVLIPFQVKKCSHISDLCKWKKLCLESKSPSKCNTISFLLCTTKLLKRIPLLALSPYCYLLVFNSVQSNFQPTTALKPFLVRPPMFSDPMVTSPTYLT